MRWLKKAAEAVNQADPVTSAMIAISPSIRRVRTLEQRGTPANGVITGIEFSLNDSTTRKEYAITVSKGAAAARRFGVRANVHEAPRLRLGVPVVLKIDGDRGILDWDAMAAAWGMSDRSLPQDSLRKPPADGIVDTSLDARVQRHLKRWTPTEATVVAMQRLTVLGVQTLNWDIQIQLPDGTVAVSKRDEVPSYAQWFVAPGAAVPAVVDPDDPTRASIDWPALALARHETVGFDDDPPAGSIAAQIEAGRGTSAAPVMGAASPPPAPAVAAGPVTLDGTMQSWVTAYRDGHMKRKALDRTLDDWRAAGMCTQAQVDAARAAADLP